MWNSDDPGNATAEERTPGFSLHCIISSLFSTVIVVADFRDASKHRDVSRHRGDSLSSTIRLSEPCVFLFLFLLPHLLRVIEFLNTGRYVQSRAPSCFIVISSTCTCRFPYTSCRYLPDCWSRDWFLLLIKICIYCEKQKKRKVWVLCMVFPSDLVDESK